MLSGKVRTQGFQEIDWRTVANFTERLITESEVRGEDLWCITGDVSKNLFSGVIEQSSLFFQWVKEKMVSKKSKTGFWIIHSHEKT